MSSQTRERIELLISLSPWLAFFLALAWSALASLWEDVPPDRVPSSGRQRSSVRQRRSRR